MLTNFPLLLHKKRRKLRNCLMWSSVCYRS